MNNLNNLEELVRNFLRSSKEEIQTTPEFDKRVFNSAARAYQENLKNSVHRRLNKQKTGLTSASNELEKRRRDNQEPLNAALWRAFMKNKLAKFAAAAVFVIAALVAFQFLGNPFGSKLTFASVIEPILNADTASYDIVGSLDDGSTSVTHCAAMGSRFRETRIVGGEEVIGIIDSENGLMLQLYNKTAQFVYYEEIPSVQNWLEDFKNRILILKGDPDFTVKELGRKQLDGKEVVGFFASGHEVDITIWADVDTGLPVGIETNTEINSETYGKHKIHDILENMEFGLPMEDEMFSMEVPAGYYELKPMTWEEYYKMGTETEFIEGLRLMADTFNGGYFPDRLSPDDQMKWISEGIKRLEEMNLSKDEIEARILQIIEFIRFIPFGREDEWTYRGQGVMLGEAGTPIFWYRPQVSDTYRVIYGDLHVEDVYTENLPE